MSDGTYQNGTPAPAWWVSWYNPVSLAEFELHSPWWVSGYRCSDDFETMCAAVRAVDETHAKAQVEAAYDNPPSNIEWRFVEPLDDRSPFSGRFPQSKWMAWESDGRTCDCDACKADS